MKDFTLDDDDFSFEAAAKEAAAPAGVSILGALAGTVIGSMSPTLGLGLGIIASFGGHVTPNPLGKAFTLGFMGGMMGAGISKAFNSGSNARMSGEKPTIKQVFADVGQGLKKQFPLNLLNKENVETTVPPIDPPLGADGKPLLGVVDYDDHEASMARIMGQLEASAADYQANQA